MLTPAFYENSTEHLESILRETESHLLQDIVRRIADVTILAGAPETAQYEYELLRTLNLFDEDYNQIIADMTARSLIEIDLILNRATSNALEVHRRDYIRKIGRFVPFEQNQVMQQITRSYAENTKETFQNLSNTSAIGYTDRTGQHHTVTEYLHRRLTQATANVSLGAETYDQAIKRTVRELANSGLRNIDYESGRSMSLVAVARMNVLTSIGQLSMNIEMIQGEELNMNHVETTAHNGARPDHQPWQGRIFSLDRSIPELKQYIQETRGY